MIDPSKQSDCLGRPGSVPVIAVAFARWSATASGSTMQPTHLLPTYRRALAAFTRALGACRAAKSGVQAIGIKSCFFHRAQGLDVET